MKTTKEIGCLLLIMKDREVANWYMQSLVYLPDPQTTKRNRAKSQGPTGDPSSCDF